MTLDDDDPFLNAVNLTDPNNCRPISLITVIPKIFEGVISTKQYWATLNKLPDLAVKRAIYWPSSHSWSVSLVDHEDTPGLGRHF